ncbi:acyltransferase domain-containing protein, partial [Streptomyces sp. sk2.1]|uniref:acyltransferase domain-containing protein n=1 Tax=Streptomyces sp. sk2.1 TaxID=2478959 RepID=UPI00292A4119
MKSNIGHAQAAAGVGGVIKMVMAMREGVLPRTLHVGEPSSHVDWSSGAVELLREARSWPESGRPRRAGVSSFGISGTNAHVVIEQAPVVEAVGVEESVAGSGPLPWLITARSERALRAQAARLRPLADAADDTGRRDIGHSLLTTRSMLDHRAVVLAADRAELLSGLDALTRGAPSSHVVTGVVSGSGRTAFLFTGQGSQRAGMGRELYVSQPVFAAAFDAVCERFDARLGGSLKELVFAEEGGVQAAALDGTQYAQAALFALEVALYRLMEHHGVTP